MLRHIIKSLSGGSHLIFLLSFMGIGLYFFPFPFKDGIPALSDLPTHYLRAKLVYEGYSIYDWYHGYFLGITPFTFYPPLLSYLIALLSTLSFGLIEFDMIFKVLLVFVYVGVPYSVYYALRKLDFDKHTSSLAAYFALFITIHPGFGPSAIFEIGLFANAFALLFFMPALAHAHKFLFLESNEGAIKNLALALLLSSAILISNVVISLFLFITIAAVVAVELVIRKSVDPAKRLAVLFIPLPLISAFWVIPFVNYQYLTGPDANWSLLSFSDFVSRYKDGSMYGPVFLNWLAILGGIFALFLIKDIRYRMFLLIAILGVLFGLSLAPLPQVMGKIEFAMMNRALSFVSFPIAIFAALAVITLIKFTAVKYFKTDKNSFASIIVVALCFFVYNLPWLTYQSRLAVTDSDYVTQQDSDFRETMVWLNENAENQVVVVNKSVLPPITYLLPDAWVALKTRSLLLDGTYLPQSKFPMKGDILALLKNHGADQNEIHTKLVKWGVRFVVLGRGLPEQLNPQFFNLVTEIGDFQVFEIKYFSQPIIKRNATEKNSLDFGVDSPTESQVSLPVNYHPNWHISLNGKEVRFRPDAENLIQIEVPQGASSIIMRFSPGWVEYSSSLISLLSLFLMGCVFFIPKGREVLRAYLKK